jgi:putative ABC transport system permease protein
MHYVMDSDFALNWGAAMAIISGGALANLLAGLAFAWRPLASKPAQILRHTG